MQDISETLNNLNLGSDLKVDEELIGELLNMMKNQSISSLSLPELVENLGKLKVGKEENKSKVNPPNSPSFQEPHQTQTTPPSNSPAFEFKSPTENTSNFSDNKNQPINLNNFQSKQHKDLSGFYESARSSMNYDPSTKLEDLPNVQSTYTSSGISGSFSRPNSSSTPEVRTNQKGPPFEGPFTFGKDASSRASSAGESVGDAQWFWGTKNFQSNGQENPLNSAQQPNGSNTGFTEFVFPRMNTNVTASSKSDGNTPGLFDNSPKTSISQSELPFSFSLGAAASSKQKPKSRTGSRNQQSSKLSTAGATLFSANSEEGVLPDITASFGNNSSGVTGKQKYSMGSTDILDSLFQDFPSFAPTGQNEKSNSTARQNQSNQGNKKNNSAEKDESVQFPVFTIGATDILHDLNDYSSSSPTSSDDGFSFRSPVKTSTVNTKKMNSKKADKKSDSDDGFAFFASHAYVHDSQVDEEGEEMILGSEPASPFNLYPERGFDGKSGDFDFDGEVEMNKNTPLFTESPKRIVNPKTEETGFRAKSVGSTFVFNGASASLDEQSQTNSTTDSSNLFGNVDLSSAFNLGSTKGAAKPSQKKPVSARRKNRKDQKKDSNITSSTAEDTFNLNKEDPNKQTNKPDPFKTTSDAENEPMFAQGNTTQKGSPEKGGDDSPIMWGQQSMDTGGSQDLEAKKGTDSMKTKNSKTPKKERHPKKSPRKEDNVKQSEDFSNISTEPMEQSETTEASKEAPQAESYTKKPNTPKMSASDLSLINLAELYSKQGKELYQSSTYERALDAYTKCLNLAPKGWQDRATCLGNRAATFVMLNRFTEAVDDCDEALRLDGQLVKLHVRKGRALLRLGHLNTADDAFTRVLEFHSLDLLSSLPSADVETKLAVERSLDINKQAAREGLKEVEKLRDLVRRLIYIEGQMKYGETLELAEEILRVSPCYRLVQVAKANALCETQQYELAKRFMEEILTESHRTILSLHAHPAACVNKKTQGHQLPQLPPAPLRLLWEERREDNMVDVDLHAVVEAMLCMGADLAQVYLVCLKNIVVSRVVCADVMLKTSSMLLLLSSSLTPEEGVKGGKWQWVNKELSNVKNLIHIKINADQKFKNGAFRDAVQFYTAALKLDISARRWNAIILSNRAAAHMALGMFCDAASDCHQAVSRDPGYSKAYLRRARAYRSMNKYHDSVRDYRRYLSSDPPPTDFAAVQGELAEMAEAKRQEIRQSSQRSFRYQSGGDATGGGGTRSSYESGFRKTNSFNSGQQTGNTGSWMDDDDTEFYRRFDRYKTGAAGAKGKTGYSKSKDWSHKNTNNNNNYNNNNGNRYKQQYDLESDSDDSDEDQNSSGKYSKPGNKTNNNSTNSNKDSKTQEKKLSSDFDTTDHYTILGITMQASERDIKMAYRQMALKYHPDKNREEGAEEKFKLVSLAYTVLSDKVARRRYDLTRPVGKSGGNYGRR